MRNPKSSPASTRVPTITLRNRSPWESCWLGFGLLHGEPSEACDAEAFTAGDLRVDFDRREVFVGSEEIRLTATEYHLLSVLVRHAGRVRTHYQLIHEVWGSAQYQGRRAPFARDGKQSASETGKRFRICSPDRYGTRRGIPASIRFCLPCLFRAGGMKKTSAITCVFVDVGGVLAHQRMGSPRPQASRGEVQAGLGRDGRAASSRL